MKEREDIVVCALCGHEAIDLTWHLRKIHNMKASKYRESHGTFVSPLVSQKRRDTNMERHGELHFTNRPAAALTNKTFAGGHSLRDPDVRRKAEETKESRYGDRHYTNRAKAKKTCKERYGVEYTGSVPEIVDKRVATLKKRYGRVFNVDEPHNKTHPPKEFVTDYTSGVPMEELSRRYGVSDPTLRRWASEEGVSRRASRPAVRLVVSPLEAVRGYFEACDESGVMLSFGEYGNVKGRSLTTRMKRLFNAGKSYAHLKASLFAAARDRGLRDAFLAMFR